MIFAAFLKTYVLYFAFDFNVVCYYALFSDMNCARWYTVHETKH